MKKTCVEQKGLSLACYPCAKLKMKCDPAADTLTPSRPAPNVGPSSSQKPSKKAKVVKTPENVESSGSKIAKKTGTSKTGTTNGFCEKPTGACAKKEERC